jgi:TatD DNase family protein
MTYWTDAHCHLQDQFLRGDDNVRSDVHDTLERAYEGGVDRVIVIGTDITTSHEAIALANEPTKHVDVFATIGLHPHDALQGTESIAALARDKNARVVGIGECGLDYFYEHSPREVQQRAFREQIQLAHELDLALVIHARDAWDDLYRLLEEEGTPERTVIHCFTGGPLEAQACLDLGCDISFSGIVTFKNAEALRDAARLVPLDRIHVETDSPFLAPVPFRGKPNEPARVAVVGEAVANVRGEDVEILRERTTQNTARLFGLSSR